MIDPKLQGKTVLVTGGAMNIGAAISRAFAVQGARVAVHHVGGETPGGTLEHQRSSADQVEAFVESLPGAISVEGDFLEHGVASRVFDEVYERMGSVDVLVNNAGYTDADDTYATIDDASLERSYRVNVIAPAMMMAELSRRLPEEAAPGSIAVINISTDAARAFPGQVGYGTSKAALESLTRGAALDLGPQIRVNAIAPGPVQTGWMTEELIESVLPDIPLGRVGTPDDIAEAAVFLASYQARWISGQIIQVAGGHSL